MRLSSFFSSQCVVLKLCVLFLFTGTATTDIYTLSLHDALPICASRGFSCSTLQSMPATRSTSPAVDRKSTRLNSSHVAISYAVFCLKKKNKQIGIGVR